MTPAARIQGAIELLEAIDQASGPADRTSAAFFRARRYIGSKDRKEILDHAYACLRSRARLSWHVKNEVTARLLVVAKLLLIDRWSADRVSGSFDGGQYRPAPLNKEERALLVRLEKKELSPEDQPIEVRLEIPQWLVAQMKQAFGPEWIKEAETLREEAPLDLRVNLLKTNRETIEEQLKAQQIETIRTLLSPVGLRLRGRLNLPRLDLFQEGAVEVQDEGSQLVALMLGAKPGERVVDFCAGAGGKTLAIAAQMQNKGKIVATDTLEGRLERSSTRLNRAGVHNVERKALSSERDPWVKRHAGDFDRVLVDAPCSGTGTWRRNPDQKWRLHTEDIARLVKLQRAILDSATRLVKPGGRLVYATCSLLAIENEKHIPSFLAQHPDFSIEPLSEFWSEISDAPCPGNLPWLRLSPATHHCDGFFAVRFKRSAFQIRRAKASDAAGIAAIHEAGWHLAYKDIVSKQQLAEKSAEKRLAHWQKILEKNEELVLLATDGKKAMGFLYGGIVKDHEILSGALEGADCEIYSLHCREEAQGQGLGHHLMRVAATEFQKAGKEQLILWAYRENRFRRFYEKLGGKMIAEGLDEGIADVAYGWEGWKQIYGA